LFKNMTNNKKLDFDKIINIILFISAIAGLLLGIFVSVKLDSSSSVSLMSIAGFLRFFTGNKNQMIIDIALHNSAIAILCLLLSFLSRGILGSVILFFNSFIIGAVLCGVNSFQSFGFVFLEFLGICLAAFIGTNLAKKRYKNNLALFDILKRFGLLSLIIVIIYFLAAIIESNLLLNHWS